MDILDSFKEHLTPEDMLKLEESIKTLIDDKAKVRADLIVEEETKRLEALAEEFTEKEVKTRLDEALTKMTEEYETKTRLFKETTVEKLQEMADAYVQEQLTEGIELAIEKLEEEYSEKMQKLEESVLDNLDKFLDVEITSKISDSLLETIAVNEAFKPIVNGIMSLFETNYVSLDNDGKKLVEDAEAKVVAVEAKLTESYETKIALQSKIDKLETSLFIESKVGSLTKTSQDKIKSMFEGKSLDEVKKSIGTVIEVLEERDNLEDDTSKMNEDLIASDDLTVDDSSSVNELDESVDEELKIKLEKINYFL